LDRFHYHTIMGPSFAIFRTRSSERNG
jgi:hypothetical protein